MKHLFIIVLLILSTVCFSQKDNTFKVLYKTTSNLDVDNLDDKVKSNPTQMKYIMKLKKDYESMGYVLKVDGKKSEFETIKKMNVSSRSRNNIATLENKTRFYVDEEVFIEQKEFLGEDLLITSPPNTYEWELTKEIKTILNYKCYKALLKSNDTNKLRIEAWYAPKLPYQFGPKGYHGLKQPLYLARAGRLYTALLSRWLIMGLRIATGKE